MFPPETIARQPKLTFLSDDLKIEINRLTAVRIKLQKLKAKYGGTDGYGTLRTSYNNDLAKYKFSKSIANAMRGENSTAIQRAKKDSSINFIRKNSSPSMY